MDTKFIGDVIQNQRRASDMVKSGPSKMGYMCSRMMVLATIAGAFAFGMTALTTSVRDLKNFGKEEESRRQPEGNVLANYGGNKNRRRP